MNDSPRCAGLEAEQSSADLRSLTQVAGDVEWIGQAAAHSINQLLVLTGQWVATHTEQAAALFAARSSSGRHTLVVPKYRPGDWTAILKAPTKVEVVQGEFRSFEWGGSHHPIPGFVVFRTALHAAKWGEASGVGTTLLGYRPRSAGGAVVLCSAVLTARVAGLSHDAQRTLYEQIVLAADAPIVNVDKSIEAEPAHTPASLSEFLEQEREFGAAFLIAALVSATQSPDAISEVALERLGIQIGPSMVANLALRLPKVSDPGEVRAVLQQHGWGAYLRRISPVPVMQPSAERRSS